MYDRQKLVGRIAALIALSLLAGTAAAAELKIAIMQAQAGDARKFQPLLSYFAKKGVSASFVTAQDYPAAAEMFARGAVDAMFSGSGIAGTMMIKGLASPLARPVSTAGTSTYSAVVIAPRGSPKFTGQASYFNGKKVIFSPLASAGEFYFRSVGSSTPAQILRAASHEAAIDALSRGQADVAVVKNRVWNKEKDKYGMLEQVGSDLEENPDNTLIVWKKLDPETAKKVAEILLGVEGDTASEAMAVKDSLKITRFIPTTDKDFKHTLELLERAGVTKDFSFKY